MTDKGRITIPTDVDVVEETIEILEKWGADALRDCDGTEFPERLRDVEARVYATYYTTRKDNAWALQNPQEIQQMYICTRFYTAVEEMLSIPLMAGLYPDMLKVNGQDHKRWWEVMDRTTGLPLSPSGWEYLEETGEVKIQGANLFHEYSVSFLAFIMWDPVHMYNAITNGWDTSQRQLTFDVRQPKTKAYSMKRLEKFLQDHPYVDVVRFTTFFHQFTLVFDDLAREKYVDWYGYSASVSPYVLEEFERETGIGFRPEFLIDEGYMAGSYRNPGRELLAYMDFTARKVCALAREMVDMVHAHGKEAMMFLGDHWIGTEPYMPYFASIGLDAVVGSVGNGQTYRILSGIAGVKYKEGRLLPYFFPDTFHEKGNPKKEACENWLCARRALLRSPIDRIGYGGYLKLALQFPDFVDYVAQVCREFRGIYENIRGTRAYCHKRVAVLNAWGRKRAWGNHMVHHALYHKENLQYAGVLEILSGAPYQVDFIDFEDLKIIPDLREKYDIIMNIGDRDTAQTGGSLWEEEEILTKIRGFIYHGGGFVGVGEPSGHKYQGKVLQLSAQLGVELETGEKLGFGRYNTQVQRHFITEDVQHPEEMDWGRSKDIFALEHTAVLAMQEGSVCLGANAFGQGRCVYISGLMYNFTNARLLHRALLWSASSEDQIHTWFSTNESTEVHAFVENKKFCVVNNTYGSQSTRVYTRGGDFFDCTLAPGEILWREMA